MARPVLPDALARREWLEQPLDAARALAVAEAYLAEDRAAEAVAFLSKAGASERLRALREESIRAGDAFLLKEISRALGEEATAEHWRRLRDAATAAGRASYATEAQRQVDRLEA
jgi:hypothetical protein